MEDENVCRAAWAVHVRKITSPLSGEGVGIRQRPQGGGTLGSQINETCPQNVAI